MSLIRTSQLASTNGFCATTRLQRGRRVYHIIKSVDRSTGGTWVFTVCGHGHFQPELFDVLDDIPSDMRFCVACASLKAVHV